MPFALFPDGPAPIYEQIVAGVIYQIAAGALEPGALVSSVRELAEQLVVNPNTVARAYSELEREGILESRRGLGMEITAEAPALCKKRRRELISNRIAAALREAHASALSPDEIQRMMDDEWAKVNGQKRPREKR